MSHSPDSAGKEKAEFSHEELASVGELESYSKEFENKTM